MAKNIRINRNQKCPKNCPKVPQTQPDRDPWTAQNWSGPRIENFRWSSSGPKFDFFFRALVRSSPKFSICFGPVPVRVQSVLVHESLIPGTNVNVGKCAQGICLPPTRFCWIDIVARGLNGIHSVTFSLFSHFSSLQITKKEKKTFYPRKK